MNINTKLVNKIDMPVGGSRSAATSKVQRFVIINNDWKPLTIITNRSFLDVAVVLDPPLMPSLKNAYRVR